VSGPSRVDLLIAAAQDAVRDLRSYTDYRAQRVRLRLGQVQALCAIAAAIDRLADAITSEEN
jgi:hypothetical protein